jgi:hypothetical protein
MNAKERMLFYDVPMSVERTPLEIIKNLGVIVFFNEKETFKTLPQEQNDRAKVFFFCPGRPLSDEGLEIEYAIRKLVPAGPFSLLSVHKADREFIDTYSSATHWKDDAGIWHCMIFGRWNEQHRLYIAPVKGIWCDDFWYAGILKQG